MRAITFSLSAALLTVGAVRTQVWPTATAVAVTVRAGSVQAPFVVPGSDVWPGFYRGCSGTVGASSCTVTNQMPATSIDGSWVMGCSAHQPGSSTSDATVRYELWASTPVSGRIMVTWTPAVAGTGSAVLSFDLFDDGSVDATGSTSLPATIGPGGLPFRVRATCAATAGISQGPFGSSWSYWGTAQGTLSVHFLPTPCQTQNVGAPCGAPQLATLANLLPGVDLVGDFDAAVDIAVLVLGFAGAVIPSPLPPGCALLVAPVVTDWHLVSAQRAQWAMAVPQAVRPATFRAQMLGLDVATFSLATSQTLQIYCQ
ncbi:MAG: hypothetical protein ABIP94_02025 [Planctomycetota bacterium]